jgi:hypothetical protein
VLQSRDRHFFQLAAAAAAAILLFDEELERLILHHLYAGRLDHWPKSEGM